MTSITESLNKVEGNNEYLTTRENKDWMEKEPRWLIAENIKLIHLQAGNEVDVVEINKTRCSECYSKESENSGEKDQFLDPYDMPKLTKEGLEDAKGLHCNQSSGQNLLEDNSRSGGSTDLFQ